MGLRYWLLTIFVGLVATIMGGIIALLWNRYFPPRSDRRPKQTRIARLLLVSLIFAIIAVTIMLLFLEWKSEIPPDDVPVPANCGEVLPSGMTTIVPGDYRIPQTLAGWIADVGREVTVDQRFEIMNREVTLREFRRFVRTLSAEDAQRLRKDWTQEAGVDAATLNDAAPVRSVPWWAAADYADFLTLETGCHFVLPTVDQWLAAVAIHARPELEIYRSTGATEPAIRTHTPHIVDLLANLREWSANDCENGGHYLLGEDFVTSPENFHRKPLCRQQTLNTVGFRLITSDAPGPRRRDHER